MTLKTEELNFIVETAHGPVEKADFQPFLICHVAESAGAGLLDFPFIVLFSHDYHIWCVS